MSKFKVFTGLSNFYLVFVLLINIDNLKGQIERFKVDLNIEATDDKFRKTQAMVPVFLYKGQPFDEIADFGIETKRKPNQFNAKFPDMTGVIDTNYSFVFFGASEQVPKGYLFVVIGNNRITGLPTLIWIDKNGNLDLSDDGPPDTFFNQHGEILELKMAHPEIKMAYHKILLSRFDFGQQAGYKKLLDEHYQKNSGNHVFAGSNYSFREQRKNLRAFDFIHGTDSFRIAIKDINSNGIFNDKDYDQFMLGAYGVEEIDDRFVFEITGKQISFERGGKKYIVTNIDPAGQFVEFYYDPEHMPDRQLQYCKKIPKIKFSTTDPDETKHEKIRKFKKKPVYIYFWNQNMPEFKKDTAFLSTIQRDYGDKIHIIALNYGDNPRNITGMKYKNKIPFKIGFATLDIVNSFYVEKYPTSYLTNKRQKLCDINLTPEQLLNKLKLEFNSK
jgi:hypothetical protein